MANAEQLSILKQGVEAWNEWRDKNFSIEVDLSGAFLHEAKLYGANLSGAELEQANLSRAQLSRADLFEANLLGADLSEADLAYCNLGRAPLPIHIIKAHLNLNGFVLAGAERIALEAAFRKAIIEEPSNQRRTNLRGANLSRAYLFNADLRQADLSEADLTEAELLGANLSGTLLMGSMFSKVVMGNTVFVGLDMSEVIGLESVHHDGPSHISTDSFVASKGKIHEFFLRGCGLSDWEIEAVKLYNPNLSNEEINNIQYKMYELRATQALQISPLFVSYSHADSAFVDKIGDYLTQKGIRYWRDIHAMKAGRMEKQIDRAIRQNPTVLLVLSKYSLGSDWVEHEVRTARGLEKEMGRDVLCPVALDDSWKSSHWPKRVMEQIMEYNILDFSEWQDDSKFEDIFRKLIDGLELFYKG